MKTFDTIATAASCLSVAFPRTRRGWLSLASAKDDNYVGCPERRPWMFVCLSFGHRLRMLIERPSRSPMKITSGTFLPSEVTTCLRFYVFTTTRLYYSMRPACNCETPATLRLSVIERAFLPTDTVLYTPVCTGRSRRRLGRARKIISRRMRKAPL